MVLFRRLTNWLRKPSVDDETIEKEPSYKKDKDKEIKTEKIFRGISRIELYEFTIQLADGDTETVIANGRDDVRYISNEVSFYLLEPDKKEADTIASLSSKSNYMVKDKISLRRLRSTVRMSIQKRLIGYEKYELFQKKIYKKENDEWKLERKFYLEPEFLGFEKIEGG